MYNPFFKDWFEKDHAKPIILLGKNSYVKSALVYSNFDIDNDIVDLGIKDWNLEIRTYDANKLHLFHDEVSDYEGDYSWCCQIAEDIDIHCIILPSEYKQLNVDPNKFILINVPDLYPDKDWYWWCTELYNAGRFKHT